MRHTILNISLGIEDSMNEATPYFFHGKIQKAAFLQFFRNTFLLLDQEWNFVGSSLAVHILV